MLACELHWGVDIFASQNRYIRFADSIYLLAQIRYDINPARPAGHIECEVHIERYAYIENPVRDLYRACH